MPCPVRTDYSMCALPCCVRTAPSGESFGATSRPPRPSDPRGLAQLGLSNSTSVTADGAAVRLYTRTTIPGKRSVSTGQTTWPDCGYMALIRTARSRSDGRKFADHLCKRRLRRNNGLTSGRGWQQLERGRWAETKHHRIESASKLFLCKGCRPGANMGAVLVLAFRRPRHRPHAGGCGQWRRRRLPRAQCLGGS